MLVAGVEDVDVDEVDEASEVELGVEVDEVAASEPVLVFDPESRLSVR